MAATTQYLRNTQTGGGTGGAVYDLSTTQGTGETLSASVSSNTFAEVLRFQITIGADLPATNIPFSISINAISASSEVRWRVQELNSSNTVIASSAYATVETTTGTKTGTISFSNSWADGDRLAISVEYRRTSGSGSRTLTLNVNNANSYIQPDLVPQAQALTQASRFDNSQTFYGSTVTTGAVNLTASLYTNAQTFYSQLVSTQFFTVQQDFGLVNATPDVYFNWGLITETPAAYTNDLGDLQAGGATQNLTAALYTNNNTFYGPTVTTAYSLTAARYDNEQTFYAPTVTSTYALTATRYDNAQTFYDHVVTATYALTAARYDNEQTFYAATVTSSITLTAARFDNNNTFYDATVERGAVDIAPDLFENQNTFYDAIVTQEGGPQFLVPDRFDNVSEFYAATVSAGAVDLLPPLYENEQTFYEAEVTQDSGEQFIEPEILVNQNVFYIHSITGGSQPVVEGGGKGSGKKRKKRVYVERDGKIYIFANEYQAAAFIQSEEQDKPKDKKAAKKAPELVTQPLEKIDVGSVKELADKYSKQQYFTDLLNKNDYDQLVYQYRLLLTLETQARLIESQDEEEIAILLMAA